MNGTNTYLSAMKKDDKQSWKIFIRDFLTECSLSRASTPVLWLGMNPADYEEFGKPAGVIFRGQKYPIKPIRTCISSHIMGRLD